LAGAVVVGDVVAVEVALGLFDPLEHPGKPMATTARAAVRHGHVRGSVT
jgi:hypothetical protein